ncbi:hypothetical protein Bhyg_01155, partial [Pseudolycoriella hygida]
VIFLATLSIKLTNNIEASRPLKAIHFTGFAHGIHEVALCWLEGKQLIDFVTSQKILVDVRQCEEADSFVRHLGNIITTKFQMGKCSDPNRDTFRSKIERSNVCYFAIVASFVIAHKHFLYPEALWHAVK